MKKKSDVANTLQDKQFHHHAYEARYAAGKALRKVVQREALGDFSPSKRDILSIFAATNAGRLPSLLPLRHQLMSASAFAFLRGAADLMATDLASAPTPGIMVQAGGDAHLMNFGAFASPEGNVLFDLNDFDETLPGVDFTIDLKRLCASVAIAAQIAGQSDHDARAIARAAAKSYRGAVHMLADLSPIEAWNARVPLSEVARSLRGRVLSDALHAAITKAPRRDESDEFPKIERGESDKWRIVDRAPKIFHVETSTDVAARIDIAKLFDAVRATLSPQVAALLQRYRYRDAAFKAVGVGSVGTYCAIGLFMTEDDEPLFLQLKEARVSVLERLCKSPWTGAQGARVVSGQLIMQAASDPFLGWARDEASGRQFYVRHLKTRRLGSISELLLENALPSYAALCGRTLARAHVRSTDAAVLAGYLGKSDAFDDAMASFAAAYSTQNQKDFKSFCKSGAPSGK